MSLRNFRTVAITLMASVLLIANLRTVRTAYSQDAPADTHETIPDSLLAEEVAPDSPRQSLTDFLTFCRAGEFTRAAIYLDSPAQGITRERDVKRLKAVLDRYLWIDLDQISPRSEGEVNDGLPPGTDEIGTILGPTGKEEPIRVVRKDDADGARWVFSRPAVDRIDAWYQTLGNQWLLENLPEPLLRTGPQKLLWWQWLALPILFVLAWVVGMFLSRLSRAFLSRVTARTKTQWDDAIVTRVGGPLTLAWALILMGVSVPWLDLNEAAGKFITGTLRTGFFVVFFWAILRTIDIIAQVLLQSAWARSHPASRSLVPIGSRVAKVGISGIAIVAVISELGFPVASLIAGLGIGGLALALAAQKTVENLFGSFSIGVDQPFREGDTVKVEDFIGVVEEIGLRSTRFRTLDRTIITIPNGKLADSRLESFTARDRIRFVATIGLVYGTTAAQMKTVLEGFEKALRNHPRIWPDVVNVRFEELASSSLNIKVMAWFQTADFNEFQVIRQEMLLRFMEIVEASGTQFAFPTQTLHLVK